MGDQKIAGAPGELWCCLVRTSTARATSVSTYLDSDKPQFPQPVQAPKGAPNVVLILLDDAGFGQFSTFGGGVPSPTMDKLAAEGLRYNRFHTTALCSPTRAALITGRDFTAITWPPASLARSPSSFDGYTAVLPKSAGSVGEVLRQNGYMTAWMDKTTTLRPGSRAPQVRWTAGLTGSASTTSTASMVAI